MIISVFDRVENIVGKGEIAFTSNFFFAHNAFKGLLSQTHQKVSLCGNGLNIKYSVETDLGLPSPCSSVGSVEDLRTGGCCFDPSALSIFFLMIDDTSTV